MLRLSFSFPASADIRRNGTLKFNTRSRHQVDLTGKNDVIRVHCAGPYVLYMYVCYMNLTEQLARGYLEVQVAGQKTPVASVNLTTASEVCQGLQRSFYLQAQEQASLHLYVNDSFKLKNASVGLSSLLGSQCDY